MAQQPDDLGPDAPGDRHWWRDFAACKGQPPAKWYPEAGASPEDAKAICHACPVERVCLEVALANRERFGVWGGASETERRRILRSRYGAHPEMRRAPRPRRQAG